MGTVAAPVDIGTLITRTPGVVGGRPRLAGTRMPVSAIAALQVQGNTAEEIHDQFPHLEMGLIYAALAYFEVNREEIEAYWASEKALEEELIAAHPNGWKFQTRKE